MGEASYVSWLPFDFLERNHRTNSLRDRHTWVDPLERCSSAMIPVEAEGSLAHRRMALKCCDNSPLARAKGLGLIRIT